jgi:hypothetical protein
MFAMIFTMIVAALIALVWAVLSSLTDASGRMLPRDPTTLELFMMAVMTLAVYAWANRYRVARDEPLEVSPEVANFGFSESADDHPDEDAAEHAA